MSTEDEAPSKYIEGDLMKKEDKKKVCLLCMYSTHLLIWMLLSSAV